MSRPLVMLILLLLGVFTLLVGVALGKRQRRMAPPSEQTAAAGTEPCRVCGLSAPAVARYCPRCGARIASNHASR